MSVRFASEQRRLFWLGLAYSIGVEFAAFLLFFSINPSTSAFAGWAALAAVVATQLFLVVYGLFNFARRWVFFVLYMRDSRSQIIVDEFNRLNFPRPENFYHDADHYLREVALSTATSPEGALFAGTLLGALEAHRQNGPRTDAIFLEICIERAMKLMTPWGIRDTMGLTPPR